MTTDLVADGVDAEEWEDVLGSGRLLRKIIEKGEDDSRPLKGHQVVVDLKKPGSDPALDEPRRLRFCLQECEVSQALDLVVALMKLGERCEVKCDPEFAAGSWTHFEVTLISIEPEPVPLELALDARKAIGQRKMDRGNAWYYSHDYSSAVQCYRKAVDYFDDDQLDLEVPLDRFALDAELQQVLNERLKAFNNLAQAQIKLGSWEAALASLKCVLKVEPNNEKALFRKAKCLEERGRLEEAIGILRRVVRLYPENKTARVDLSRLVEVEKANRKKEEELMRRMFGLDRSAVSKQPPSSSSSSRRDGLGVLTNRQWLVVGALMGGAGVLLGGLVSWLNVKV